MKLMSHYEKCVIFLLSALGLAGAFAAKSALMGGGSQNGLFGGGSSSGGYGQSYGYNSGPTTLTTSYPTTYYASQTYVPQQPQTYGPPPQPTYVQPQPTYVSAPAPSYGPPQSYAPPQSYGQQQSFGGPIGAALSWKAGIVSGITSGISSKASQFGFPSHQQAVAPAPSYAYNSYSAEVPSVQYEAVAQPAPVPNKPVYVICDN